MPANGTLIEIIYNPGPYLPGSDHCPGDRYTARVVKQTKIGFKVQNLDWPGLYEDVIFYPDGRAREWHTLRWRLKEV